MIKRSANVVLVLLHLREGGECSSDQEVSQRSACTLALERGGRV